MFKLNNSKYIFRWLFWIIRFTNDFLNINMFKDYFLYFFIWWYLD